MSLSNIKTDIFDRIATSGETVIYPNISEDPPTTEHIRIDVLPAETSTIGLNGVEMEQGIVNVLVYSKQGTGDIKSTQRSEAILALFPRNLELSSCRFDTVGTIAPSFIDGSWLVTPITFNYHNLS